jgi:hypothetical protein
MSKMEDELALRTLMGRYVDAVNRRDESAWADTWAEDATWNLLGTEVTGKAQIVGLWQQMMAGFEFAIMMPSSGLFDVDGERATGHWYLQEFTRDLEGNGSIVLSRYLDSYVKKNGLWVYQSRRYSFMYHGAPDLSGSYIKISQP